MLKNNTIRILNVTGVVFILVCGFIIANKYVLKKNAFELVKPEVTGLEGKELPAFSILLSDSLTMYNTAGIPAGRSTALVYFSPDCPTCKLHIRGILDDVNSFKDVQLYLLTPLSFTAMKGFYKEFGLARYHSIMVGVDTENFFGNYFKTHSVPFTALYGKDKRLKHAFIGYVDSKQLLSSMKN